MLHFRLSFGILDVYSRRGFVDILLQWKKTSTSVHLDQNLDVMQP